MDPAHAQQLAHDLMRLHNLPPEWSFKLDRSKVCFGKCYYSKKQISLSRYLVELNDEEEVRDTILHEIAHALAPRAEHMDRRGDPLPSRLVAMARAVMAPRLFVRSPNTPGHARLANW